MVRRDPVVFGSVGQRSSRSSRSADAGPDLIAQRSNYAAKLDAADPNNRFIRRRNGVAQGAIERYNEHDLWFIRNTARHMDANDFISTGFNRVADQVIQDSGFTPRPNTGDDQLDYDMREGFRAWADDPNSCDYNMRTSFSGMQWDLYRMYRRDGDVFAYLLDNGRIQIVDADQVCSGDRHVSDSVVGGVEWIRGKPYRYFVREDTEGWYGLNCGSVRGIRAYDDGGRRQFLHWYNPQLVAQRRGLSSLHCVMVKSGMLDDLEFATLVKAQSSADIAGVIKSNGQSNVGSIDTRTNEHGELERTETIRVGTLLRLMEGEEIDAFAPPVPSNEQMSFTVNLYRQIGSALDLPYEMLLLDSSLTNFSGWRGAVDVARMAYRREQSHAVDCFHRHVWRWWVDSNLSTLGRTAASLADSGALYRHTWRKASWRHIQPLEDSKAEAINLENNLISPSGATDARGVDYGDVVRETVRDNGDMISAAIKRAEEINQAHPNANVDWREVARWSMPSGIRVSGKMGDTERSKRDDSAE